MSNGIKIAFFGSSLVSAYWNGAATYYRGIVRALHARGHRVVFFEPDAFDRQQHRDIDDPEWAEVLVYPATHEGVRRALDRADGADLIVKASGVGVFDDLLEVAVVAMKTPRTRVAFWDVDAPATLDRVRRNPDDPFAALIGSYDIIFTYGGGPPVIEAYTELGARRCVPIYNALDPETHHPVWPEPRFECDLAFLGNRLPDREQRVDEFFVRVAKAMPDRRFLLGGSGWGDRAMPDNVHYAGHVYTRDHNAWNVTPRAVLNVSRDSMASTGYSPATRVFEAAGAGGCLITDAWEGIEGFLEPGEEVLVARSGDEVVAHLESLTPERARAIGDRARARMLREHTYEHRAVDVEEALGESARASRRARRRSRPASDRMRIVIFGLSITSSWGNGHATTYRGLVRELSARGHDVLFLERDVPWYAANRDLAAPPYGETRFYTDLATLRERFAADVRDADLIVVGSFVPDGVEIGTWVTDVATGVTAFYDIDTPVTLAKLEAGCYDYLTPELIGRFDLYLSFTGGPTLERLERELGARRALPLYCSVDPELYGPEEGEQRYALSYMGTYSPDRQAALDQLLLEVARRSPLAEFAVAGPQYPPELGWPANVERTEHLPPARHRGFYNASRFTLNITRRDMIAAGYAPSVRLFEAAACGVPIISDIWDGIETFFEPGREILLARTADDVQRILGATSERERRAIGARARERALGAHTAAHRAAELEAYAIDPGRATARMIS